MHSLDENINPLESIVMITNIEYLPPPTYPLLISYPKDKSAAIKLIFSHQSHLWNNFKDDMWYDVIGRVYHSA